MDLFNCDIARLDMMSRGPSSLSALACCFCFFDFPLQMFPLCHGCQVWILEAARPRSEKDDSSKVLRNQETQAPSRRAPDPICFSGNHQLGGHSDHMYSYVIRHLIGHLIGGFFELFVGQQLGGRRFRSLTGSLERTIFEFSGSGCLMCSRFPAFPVHFAEIRPHSLYHILFQGQER